MSICIAGGEQVGAFTYGSGGPSGWGIIQLTGEAPLAAAESAVGYTVRLQASPASDGGARTRRLVWMGAPREPWRFLIRTIEAGPDASNRPDNNFSHGLVVRRSGGGSPVVRPSELWNSPDWLAPYGAAEVARADLAAVAEVLPADTNWNVGMLARRSGLLLQLATIMGRIEQARRTNLPLVIRARMADEGALYLDAALSLVPPELLWDMTFEIRTGPVQPTRGGPLIQVGVADSEEPAGPGDLRLGRIQTDLAGPVPCQDCGLPEQTWASLLGAALADVEQAAVGSDDRDEAARHSLELAAALAAMPQAADAAPLADRVWDQLVATPGPWTRRGSKLLALEQRLPRRRHCGLLGYHQWKLITAAEVTSPQALRSYLNAPYGEISGQALEGALRGLAVRRPDPITREIADVLLSWRREQTRRGGPPTRLTWPADWGRVLCLHRALGTPGGDAAAVAAIYLKAGMRYTEQGAQVDLEETPLLSGATAAFLNAVITCTMLGDRPLPGLGRISPILWDALLALPGLGGQWAASLYRPEGSRAFLAGWIPLAGDGRQYDPNGPVTAMLTPTSGGRVVGQKVFLAAAQCAPPDELDHLIDGLEDVERMVTGRPYPDRITQQLLDDIYQYRDAEFQPVPAGSWDTYGQAPGGAISTPPAASNRHMSSEWGA